MFKHYILFIYFPELNSRTQQDETNIQVNELESVHLRVLVTMYRLYIYT